MARWQNEAPRDLGKKALGRAFGNLRICCFDLGGRIAVWYFASTQEAVIYFSRRLVQRTCQTGPDPRGNLAGEADFKERLSNGRHK